MVRKLEIMKGNKEVYDIPIVDRNGEAVLTLGTAEAIVFQIKEEKTSEEVLIEKTVDDGIEVDTPDVGTLRLTFLPADTKDMEAGDFVFGLEVRHSETDIREVYCRIKGEITSTAEIVQDTVLEEGE